MVFDFFCWSLLQTYVTCDVVNIYFYHHICRFNFSCTIYLIFTLQTKICMPWNQCIIVFNNEVYKHSQKSLKKDTPLYRYCKPILLIRKNNIFLNKFDLTLHNSTHCMYIYIILYLYTCTSFITYYLSPEGFLFPVKTQTLPGVSGSSLMLKLLLVLA